MHAMHGNKVEAQQILHRSRGKGGNPTMISLRRCEFPLLGRFGGCCLVVGGMRAALVVCAALVAHTASGFYLPGVAPQEYDNDERVRAEVWWCRWWCGGVAQRHPLHLAVLVGALPFPTPFSASLVPPAHRG